MYKQAKVRQNKKKKKKKKLQYVGAKKKRVMSQRLLGLFGDQGVFGGIAGFSFPPMEHDDTGGLLGSRPLRFSASAIEKSTFDSLWKR